MLAERGRIRFVNQFAKTLIATLPGRAYTDAALYRAERDAVFAHSWQFVGHVEQLREPGDYFVCEIAGESLVVIREDPETVNALFNVCAHRAARLLDGDGCRQRIACPYHGWTYDRGGRLIAAPNAHNVAGFDVGDYRLPRCRVELHHGLVFVNLDDDAPSLVAQAPELLADLVACAPELPRLTFAHRTEALLAANWKVAVENFSECYHCELLHRDFTRGIVDPGTYRIEVFAHSQCHRSRARTDLEAYRAEVGADEEFVVWWLWPNFAFQRYPGGRVHCWRWTPLAVDRTRVTVDWYLPRAEPEAWERELIEHHARATFAEDIPIVERVQQGLGSRGYAPGPLMVDAEKSQYSEHAVAAIQQLWRDAMGTGFE